MNVFVKCLISLGFVASFAPLAARAQQPINEPTPSLDAIDNADTPEVPAPEVPVDEMAEPEGVDAQVEVEAVPAPEGVVKAQGATPAARAQESAASQARLWSLDELTQLAHENAAAMRVEEANQRYADWQRFRARYAWTPKLQADTLLAPVPANTDPNDLSNNFDEIAALNIGPFVRQTATMIVPLYTFGRIRTAQELAEVGVKNASIEADKARIELDLQVRRAYYGLRMARALNQMIQDGKKLVADKLTEMEDARDFGDAEFDIADFRKLQIFQADLDNRALDNAKLAELAIAGVAYLTDEELSLESVPELDVESAPAELDTFEQYMRLARKHRPEILQLDQAIEARRLQVSLQRRDFYPNIFLGASFTFGYSNKEIARQRVFREENGQAIPTDLAAAPYSNPYDQLSVGVSLGMRWTLDISQSYGQLKEAQALADKTEAQRAQAIGAIELELKKLYLEASQARERIAIQGRRLEAARRWRDQLGLSIQNAGADVSDALDPLKAYYEAKVLHMQAVLEYELARAALARGVGVGELPAVSAAETK